MKKLLFLMAVIMGTTLTATAQTASDYYFDVSRYATIDEAITDYGWSDTYLHTYYKTATYNGKTWVSMPFYFPYMASGTGNDRFAKWVERSAPTLNVVQNQPWTNNSPSESAPYFGSAAYFNDNSVSRVLGNNTLKEKKSISFYVTNITAVCVHGYKGNDGTAYNGTEVQIFECTKNADGTVTANSNYIKNKFNSTKKKAFTCILDNLNETKIYKVHCIFNYSNLREISFCTIARPTIIATPSALSFETLAGDPITQTINVSGTNLEGDITATITNDNGEVFTIDNATISQADATSGTDVTITFNPQEVGTYTGTLTLTSPNATTVTVPLTGKANPYFPVPITSAGLATLYHNQPLKIPYEEYEPNLLGVYYIYELAGTELRSARLEENIPAQTGVIVQGNSGTYKFPIIEEADPLPSAAPNSLLSGCIVNTPVDDVLAATPGTIYTLGRGKDSFINFYRYSGSTLNAYRAFLLLPGGSNAKELNVVFDGEATGIRSLETEVADDAWYSLQGIRLQGKPATKGLFIHNGKTVIVR